MEDVQSFIANLFHRMHIEALIHGNATKEDALKLVSIVERLKDQPLEYDHIDRPQSRLLPHGTKITLQKSVPNPENVNSAIEYFCQASATTDPKNRTRLALLAQIGTEKAFDLLRTKLQLGYLVSSGVRATISTEG